MLTLGPRTPRRTRPLTRTSARTGTLTLAGLAVVSMLLTGCSDDEGTASDPSATASATTSTPPPATNEPSPEGGVGEVESDEVAILSETAAGGEVSATAVALSDDESVQQFGGRFTNDKLANEISRVVARTDVAPGQVLYAAVISIGCDVPPGVIVSTSDAGVVIAAQKVTTPKVECLAPVTSVALVLVDQ